MIAGDSGWIAKTINTPTSLSSGVAAILIAIAAGPVLGFVVSSFAFVIVDFFWPEFDIPKDDKELQRFERSLSDLLVSKTLVPPREAGSFRRRHRAVQLKSYFNLLFHSQAMPQLVEYTTRRWTVYWMYANSIAAFGLATVFAIFTSDQPLVRCIEFDIRFWVEIAFLLFVIFGIVRLIRLRREIFDIAWIWLYAKARR